MAATRDKSVMRDALGRATMCPSRGSGSSTTSSRSARSPTTSGYPCVLKPVGLSASRGVIRADDAVSAVRAAERIRAIADGPLLVEEYLPGIEVAVEGLLRGEQQLEILAVFDKPDPLVGPYFEETIYVTPSRLPDEHAAARRVPHLAGDARDRAHRRARSTPSSASTAIASR